MMVVVIVIKYREQYISKVRKTSAQNPIIHGAYCYLGASPSSLSSAGRCRSAHAYWQPASYDEKEKNARGGIGKTE